MKWQKFKWHMEWNAMDVDILCMLTKKHLKEEKTESIMCAEKFRHATTVWQ